MFDYEEYERECDKIRQTNEELLVLFEEELQNSGLSAKTVRRHLSNADFPSAPSCWHSCCAKHVAHSVRSSLSHIDLGKTESLNLICFSDFSLSVNACGRLPEQSKALPQV